MIPSKQAKWTDESTYQQWVETEGIPIIREFFIQDIKKVPLEPWDRMGGFGRLLESHRHRRGQRRLHLRNSSGPKRQRATPSL